MSLSSLNSIGQRVFELESGNENVDGQMDVGHINLIGGLVTRNLIRKYPQIQNSVKTITFTNCAKRKRCYDVTSLWRMKQELATWRVDCSAPVLLEVKLRMSFSGVRRDRLAPEYSYRLLGKVY